MEEELEEALELEEDQPNLQSIQEVSGENDDVSGGQDSDTSGKWSDCDSSSVS